MLGIHRESLSYKTTILYVVLAVSVISVFNFIIWENQSELLLENQKWIIELQSSKLRGIMESQLRDSQKKSQAEVYSGVSDLVINENVLSTTVYSESGKILFGSEKNTDVENYNRELVLVNRGIARYELENKKFLHDTDLRRGVIKLYLPISILGFQNGYDHHGLGHFTARYLVILELFGKFGEGIIQYKC